MAHRHPVNVEHHDDAPLGARVADRVASAIGSWRFLIIQTVIVVMWCAVNLAGMAAHWDPYPFILLNLLFSTQAAYTGPVLLLAGNRQAAKDRSLAEHDYAVNQAAAAEVRRILEELLSNTEATLDIARHIGARP